MVVKLDLNWKKKKKNSEWNVKMKYKPRKITLTNQMRFWLKWKKKNPFQYTKSNDYCFGFEDVNITQSIDQISDWLANLISFIYFGKLNRSQFSRQMIKYNHIDLLFNANFCIRYEYRIRFDVCHFEYRMWTFGIFEWERVRKYVRKEAVTVTVAAMLLLLLSVKSKPNPNQIQSSWIRFVCRLNVNHGLSVRYKRASKEEMFNFSISCLFTSL